MQKMSGLVYAIITGSVLLGAGGCHDPRFDEASAMRQAQIQRMWTAFVDREHEGNARLAEIGRRIDEEDRNRRELLRRDQQRTKEWVEGDIQRWHDNQPVYRQALRKAWNGDLHRAWETIPPLLY